MTNKEQARQIKRNHMTNIKNSLSRLYKEVEEVCPSEANKLWKIMCKLEAWENS